MVRNGPTRKEHEEEEIRETFRNEIPQLKTSLPICTSVYLSLFSIFRFSKSISVSVVPAICLLIVYSLCLSLTPSSKRLASSDCHLVNSQRLCLTPSSCSLTFLAYTQRWTFTLPDFWPPKTGHKHIGRQKGVMKIFKSLIHFYLTSAFYTSRAEFTIPTQICLRP